LSQKISQFDPGTDLLREEVRLRQNNVIEIPLVPIEKILLPPLHIKSGIVKNFIKALNPEKNAFNELRRIFPRLSGIKIKEGRCLNLNVNLLKFHFVFYIYFTGIFNGSDIASFILDGYINTNSSSVKRFGPLKWQLLYGFCSIFCTIVPQLLVSSLFKVVKSMKLIAFSNQATLFFFVIVVIK